MHLNNYPQNNYPRTIDSPSNSPQDNIPRAFAPGEFSQNNTHWATTPGQLHLMKSTSLGNNWEVFQAVSLNLTLAKRVL